MIASLLLVGANRARKSSDFLPSETPSPVIGLCNRCLFLLDENQETEVHVQEPAGLLPSRNPSRRNGNGLDRYFRYFYAPTVR